MWDCILFSILGISRRLIRCVWKWCSDWLTWTISSCKRNITIIWSPRTVPSESPSLWILPAISGFSGEYVFWFCLINSKYLKMLGPFSLMNFNAIPEMCGDPNGTDSTWFHHISARNGLQFNIGKSLDSWEPPEMRVKIDKHWKTSIWFWFPNIYIYIYIYLLTF